MDEMITVLLFPNYQGVEKPPRSFMVKPDTSLRNLFTRKAPGLFIYEWELGLDVAMTKDIKIKGVYKKTSRST